MIVEIESIVNKMIEAADSLFTYRTFNPTPYQMNLQRQYLCNEITREEMRRLLLESFDCDEKGGEG